jgi:hypothetical protein
MRLAILLIVSAYSQIAASASSFSPHPAMYGML